MSLLDTSFAGLIDLTIKSVRGVASKVQTYRNAEGLFDNHLQVHNIQTAQLLICLEFVADVVTSLALPQDLIAHLHTTLSRLFRSLDEAHTALDRGMDKDGNLRRLWFTMLGKSALKRYFDEMEKDQILFQRAVQLVTLYAGSGITKHLTDARISGNKALARVQRLREAMQHRLRNDAGTPKMLLDKQSIPAGERIRLPYSEIELVAPANPENFGALIEYRYQDSADTRKIRDIALILSGTDVSMGIIPCQGFIPAPGAGRCELLFPLPRKCIRPRTLRELLLPQNNSIGVRFSLNCRVELARRIATAVLFIHTAKLVHKNIRPENIIILDAVNPTLGGHVSELGDSFVMGFDFARKEDSASAKAGDNEWNRNIYRHPQRQGVQPEVNFNMLHDVYSLGVVLLEIALWRSFVLVEEDVYGRPKYVENREACRFFDKTTKKLKPSHEILVELIKRAETAVGPSMGDRYRDTVVMCLKCLDGGFGDPANLVDQDGVVIGLAYIEKVLMTLDEIAV